MKNVVSILETFSKSKQLCAVYYTSKNGLSNLKFYYIDDNKKNITNRVFNDEPFFKHIYKEHKIGKNQFLDWIHKNINKKEFLHLNYKIDIILTVPLF